MREYTIIGYSQPVSGEYQGKSYNNTYLYVTYENAKVHGVACTAIKVKTDLLIASAVAVGDKVVLLCDQFGRVVEIRTL